MAQQLDRVAALADEVAEVRAATETAEAQGRHGREELSRLREQKVHLRPLIICRCHVEGCHGIGRARAPAYRCGSNPS